jgi:hypothetical protein
LVLASRLSTLRLLLFLENRTLFNGRDLVGAWFAEAVAAELLDEIGKW